MSNDLMETTEALFDTPLPEGPVVVLVAKRTDTIPEGKVQSITHVVRLMKDRSMQKETRTRFRLTDDEREMGMAPYHTSINWMRRLRRDKSMNDFIDDYSRRGYAISQP